MLTDVAVSCSSSETRCEPGNQAWAGPPLLTVAAENGRSKPLRTAPGQQRMRLRWSKEQADLRIEQRAGRDDDAGADRPPGAMVLDHTARERRCGGMELMCWHEASDGGMAERYRHKTIGVPHRVHAATTEYTPNMAAPVPPRSTQ